MRCKIRRRCATHVLGDGKSQQHSLRRETIVAAEGQLERIAAQFNGAGELIVSHFSPDQLHGVMLEVITEGRREMMREWLDGGPFVD